MQVCRDDTLWNKKLSNRSFARLSHTSQWRDCIENSFSHIIGFPLLIDSEGSDATQLPLYRVSSILTGTRYVSVPFSSLSNILCNSPEHVTELVDYFKQLQDNTAKKLSFEIRSNKLDVLFENSGYFYPSRNNLHHFVDLKKETSMIYRSFHETCKRYIKKSEKSGLVFCRADQSSQVDDFYKMYCLTRKKTGLPPMPLVFFKNLFSIFFKKKAVEIYFAEYKAKKVAGLLLIKYGDTVCVEFAVDDLEHRKIYLNYFLYWNCIKMAHQEGFEIFSLGRTFRLNSGLLQFKRGWGTQEEQMVDYCYPKKGNDIAPKENTTIYRFIRYLSPRLPMPVFRLMGNVLYKHLG